MENEWLLEEGWGLFLVLVSTFRVYNLSSSESKGRIIWDAESTASVKNYSDEESRGKRNGALEALCECFLVSINQYLSL